MERGKPRGDTDPTRDRLIAAARRIFASEGYEGATIRAITRAVGVNVGAVNHHFGSKDHLYEEVLRDVLSPLRERVLHVCAREGSTRERIEGVIRAALEHLLDNPDQPRFMVGVRLSEETFPPAILEIVGPVTDALIELVQEGQAKGFIRPGPSLLFVMSLLAQPIYFTIVMGRAPRELLPMDFGSAEGRQVLLQHMMAFAFQGIGPPAPARPEGEALHRSVRHEVHALPRRDRDHRARDRGRGRPPPRRSRGAHARRRGPGGAGLPSLHGGGPRANRRRRRGDPSSPSRPTSHALAPGGGGAVRASDGRGTAPRLRSDSCARV